MRGISREIIVIRLQNGQEFCYNPDEYDDYEYNKKLFVVKKDERWIGMYNIDAVTYIRIEQI